MSETNGENPNDPYGQTNNPDPYGGAPQSNPYGTPPPPSPYTPPPTPPANPYGAPQFNPSSVPGFGGAPQYGAPAGPTKTDGMAIGALVASILGFCTCIGFIVGIVLGIIGLGRTKDGRAGGRGLAISAIVIGAVGIVLGIIGVVLVAVVGITQIVTPGNAKVGQCVNIDEGSDNHVSMTKKSCTDSHDGEIVGVAKVTSDNLAEAKLNSFCRTVVDVATQTKLAQHSGLIYESVTENPDDIQVGDHVVCYVKSSSKLTSDVLN